MKQSVRLLLAFCLFLGLFSSFEAKALNPIDSQALKTAIGAFLVQEGNTGDGIVKPNSERLGVQNPLTHENTWWESFSDHSNGYYKYVSVNGDNSENFNLMFLDQNGYPIDCFGEIKLVDVNNLAYFEISSEYLTEITIKDCKQLATLSFYRTWNYDTENSTPTPIDINIIGCDLLGAADMYSHYINWSFPAIGELTISGSS